MPGLVEITLKSEDGGLSYDDAHKLAVSSLIALVPEAEETVHPKNKPAGFSVVEFSREAPSCTLGIIDDHLLNELKKLNGSSIEVKKAGINGILSVKVKEEIRWSDLWEPRSQKARITFRTPVSFLKGKRYNALPVVDLVFSSLVRKWNAYAPVEIDLGDFEEGAWITSFNIRTKKENLERFIFVGALGWITIKFDRARQMTGNALLRFGTYSGVGAKTSFGFGSIKVEFL